MSAIKPFIDLPMERSNRADMAEVTSEARRHCSMVCPQLYGAQAARPPPFAKAFGFTPFEQKQLGPNE